MADLDDFFAKKDRKKAKGKKFTTTEEIAKKLEETGKKVDKPKPKEKPLNADGTEDTTQQVEEEDEWKDYEEEKKDYTGLKIGNLTVSEVPESDDDRGTGENSSDNELGDGSTKHSGPWKKKEKLPEPQPEPPSEPEKPKPAEPASTGPSSYKPPALRRAAAAPTPSTRFSRNKNIAPDISSEEYFPTLNAKTPNQNESSGAWGKKKQNEGGFEVVKNRESNRTASVPDAQAERPKLSLGNKYGTLPQDQS